MTSEMSYIGTEMFEGIKQTEEKSLILDKKENSRYIDLELTTQSQQDKSSYKIQLQLSNMLVVKRLVDVDLCEAVQHSVHVGLELLDRNEQCGHRRVSLRQGSRTKACIV